MTTFLFSLICLFTTLAQATTFAPTPATRQIEFAQYIVKGTVLSQEVRKAEDNGQPHTYWNLRIDETLKGDDLGDEVTVRQPGGEIDGIGFKVAGSAELRVDEPVVLTIRDTREGEIKEIVSLSMGKFTLETENGETFLKNGLGFYLRDGENRKISYPNYKKLVDRVMRADLKDSDKKIILTPRKHTIYPGFRKPEPRKPQQKQVDIKKTREAPQKAPALQKPDKAADKPVEPFSAGNQWPLSVKIILSLFALAFVGLLVLLFRGR